MASREEFMARLGRLDTRLRTAFAVGCAERALSLYPVVGLTADPRLAAAADLAWRSACGEDPGLADIADADDGLRAAIPVLNRPSADMIGYPVCVALSCALDAIDDPTPEPAATAAGSAVEAVEVAADYHGHEPRGWSAEEEAWQLRALAACEAAGGGPARRRMFQPLGPPQWSV